MERGRKLDGNHPAKQKDTYTQDPLSNTHHWNWLGRCTLRHRHLGLSPSSRTQVLYNNRVPMKSSDCLAVDQFYLKYFCGEAFAWTTLRPENFETTGMAGMAGTWSVPCFDALFGPSPGSWENPTNPPGSWTTVPSIALVRLGASCRETALLGCSYWSWGVPAAWYCDTERKKPPRQDR